MERDLAKKYNLTHWQSRRACKIVFLCIRRMLLEQGIVALPHLGTFYISKGRRRELRIPKAMAPIGIKAYCKLKFIPTTELLAGIHKAEPKLAPRFQRGVASCLKRKKPSKEVQARLEEAQDY